MIDQMDVLNGYQARIDRHVKISMMHVRQWGQSVHFLHFSAAYGYFCIHNCSALAEIVCIAA